MDAGGVNEAAVAAKEVEGVCFLSNCTTEAVYSDLGASSGVQLYICGVRISVVGGAVIGRGHCRMQENLLLL